MHKGGMMAAAMVLAPLMSVSPAARAELAVAGFWAG